MLSINMYFCIALLHASLDALILSLLSQSWQWDGTHNQKLQGVYQKMGEVLAGSLQHQKLPPPPQQCLVYKEKGGRAGILYWWQHMNEIKSLEFVKV